MRYLPSLPWANDAGIHACACDVDTVRTMGESKMWCNMCVCVCVCVCHMHAGSAYGMDVYTDPLFNGIAKEHLRYNWSDWREMYKGHRCYTPGERLRACRSIDTNAHDCVRGACMHLCRWCLRVGSLWAASLFCERSVSCPCMYSCFHVCVCVCVPCRQRFHRSHVEEHRSVFTLASVGPPSPGKRHALLLQVTHTHTRARAHQHARTHVSP